MRIGLVVEQFDPLRGGLEQWTYQFASQLLERKHEVHVLAGRFGDQVQAMPIVAHRLGGTRTRIKFAEAAEKRLRTLDLDVIHDTGAGWYCDVFQPHGGSRLVTREHSLLLCHPGLRPLKRRVSRWLPRQRQFDRLMSRQYVNDGRILLALSQQTAADFHTIHGIPYEQIRLVYNGVDTERFSPTHRDRYRRGVRRRLGVDDQTLLLVIVAHNFRLKGVPTLLRAMGSLAARRRPAHLVVIGGKHIGHWEHVARRMGAASAITFTGPVRDTVPFYSAADVYVHPTFHDSCSLVVLEALASGVPVITSRLNGAAELITENEQGHVLDDPADVGALLARLEPMFEPSQRQRMGQAARRLALDHSLEQNVEHVLSVYEEVLQRRNSRTSAERARLRQPFVCRRTGCPTTDRTLSEHCERQMAQ